ncbi:MAG: hypothetical protein ACHQDD_11150 [Steroidobacterales bacterium]
MLRIQTTTLLAGLLLAATSFAQVPADAPAGATGLCKDGTYWTNATKKGACHGHKGIKTWYASGTGASGGAAASTPAPAAAAPSAPAAAAPAAPSKSVTAPPKSSTSSSMPAATAAPGGGPGMVWVNKNSKVYHCPSDRWYGKTKNGAYMSEADAKAQGNRPDHGKACQ